MYLFSDYYIVYVLFSSSLTICSNRNKLYVKQVIRIASVARFVPTLHALKPCIAPSINPKTSPTRARIRDFCFVRQWFISISPFI